MRCGTNTNIYPTALDDNNVMDWCESIRRISAAGFKTLDLTSGALHLPNYFLLDDDWERRIDEIGETAAKCGMEFSQLHLPFHKKGDPAQDPRFKTPGFEERYEEAMRRCYIAAGRLGIPWAAAHCLSLGSINFDREKSAKANHEYYDKYVELGIKHGVGTAFENMVQGSANGGIRVRYTANPDDLIDFVDSYNDPKVAILWDFGHANISGVDQPSALRKIGKRLKCVHVDDNFGETDNHFIPFVGTVKWHEIIPVLAEIGYTGECSLEVGQFTKRAPRALQDSLVRSAYDACRYLCDLFDKAEAELKAKA